MFYRAPKSKYRIRALDELFSEHVEVNKYNCTEEYDVVSRL